MFLGERIVGSLTGRAGRDLRMASSVLSLDRFGEGKRPAPDRAGRWCRAGDRLQGSCWLTSVPQVTLTALRTHPGILFFVPVLSVCLSFRWTAGQSLGFRSLVKSTYRLECGAGWILFLCETSLARACVWPASLPSGTLGQ